MVDFKDLLKAGVHFGHKISFGNPKMKPYLWGAKNRVHLIDISKTAFLLEHAGKKLEELASKGGSILWVGTKKPAQKIILQASTSLKMPYVINRWIGGTLSNFGQIKKAITRLLHLQDILKKSTSYYTKKEMVMLQKQVDRLERNIGGIVDLDFPPAAIVVVDAKRENSAIKEAAIMGVPIFSLVDSNTDPSLVTYVIPGNDDSPKSIEFIITYLATRVEDGKKVAAAKKAAEKEIQQEAKATSKPAPKKPAPKPTTAKPAVEKKASPFTKALEDKPKVKTAVKTPEKKAAPKTTPKPAAKTAKPVEKKPAAKKTTEKK